MSNEHECGCPICVPSLNPQGPREHEGHVAVRFKDYLPVPGPPARFLEVYFNGVHQPNAVEAWAGEHGWLIRLSGRLHHCHHCHGDLCMERVYGEVRVTLAHKPPPATLDIACGGGGDLHTSMV